MSEIRLNKPLYNESGPPSSGTGKPSGPQQPAPRPARPALWMRGAALAVDLLLLHGAALLVLKLAFQPIVALGTLGPFVGLAFGALYLAVGSSMLTEGRTIGKLVMRLQTADARTGTDLPLGRAFMRAVLMILGLVAYAIIGLQVEQMADPEKLEAGPILLQMGGFAVAAAWYVGNLFHAWFDPYGRSMVDRAVGSVVVSTEAPAENLQEFLRAVRETPDPAASRRASTAFFGTALMILALDVALSWFWTNQFRQVTPEQRTEALAQRRAFAVTGFPLPVDMALDKDAAADSKTTSPQGVQFQYRRRGLLTAEQVKSNPTALTAIDRVTSAMAETIRAHAPATTGTQTAAAQDQTPGPGAGPKKEPVPETARIQVSFAEYGDLFFASQAANVYSEARMLDLEALRKEALEKAAPGTAGTAEAVTTGTAEAAGTAEAVMTTGTAETAATGTAPIAATEERPTTATEDRPATGTAPQA